MIEKLKQFAKINAIDVIETNNLEFLNAYGMDVQKDYDCNDNVCFAKALSVSANSAQAIIAIDSKSKLDSIMKTHSLYVVFNCSDIAENLIEAYKLAKTKKSCAYYIFMSGESKTADIEKTLVSGVQGPKVVKFVCVKS